MTDLFARCKRIMALVDSYEDWPHTRGALREALIALMATEAPQAPMPEVPPVIDVAEAPRPDEPKRSTGWVGPTLQGEGPVERER